MHNSREYYVMPQAVDKEEFLRISGEISKLCSFVLAPLGFPHAIRELEPMEVFTSRCQAIYQTVVEVVSDIVYKKFGIDESIMALSTHLWIEEKSDRDAREALAMLNNTVRTMFQPPNVVQVPNIPDHQVEEIVSTIASCIRDALPPKVSTKSLAIESDDDRMMYRSVFYSLGYLVPQQDCVLDSALYTKVKIQCICRGIEKAFSILPYDFEHVDQLHAMIDCNTSETMQNLVEEAFLDYYLIADPVRDQASVMDAEQLVELEDLIRPDMMEGDRLLRYRMTDNAIAAYHRVLHYCPLNHFSVVPALTKLAECYLEVQKLERALQYATMALRILPTHIEAHRVSAAIYEALGEAPTVQNRFLVRDGHEALQFYVNAFVLDGSRSMELSDAIERVSRSVGKHLAHDIFYARPSPTKLPVQWLVDSYFTSFSSDVEMKGSRSLDKTTLEATSSEDVSVENLARRAFHRKRCGQYTESLEDCRKVLERKEDFTDLYKLLNLHASYLYVMGDLVRAYDEIQQSLNLEPTYMNSLIKKAGILGEMGRLEEAHQVFEDAIQIDVNYADIYLHRGQLALINGDFLSAVRDLRRSHYQCSHLPISAVTYGMALYRNRSVYQARQVFQQAIEDFPDSTEVPLFYADLCADLGDFGEAMKQYRRASQLTPTCPLPFLNAGRAFVAMNDQIHAISHFARAMELDERSSAAHLDKAQALFAQGQTADAFGHYEDAIEYARFLPEVEDAISHREIAKAQLWITEKLGVELRQLLA